MTVAVSTYRSGPYPGNGVTTSFPFDFKVFSEEDVRVILTDVDLGIDSDLVLDSDYSVALNPDQDSDPGGTITYPLAGDPMESSHRLTPVSNLLILQPLDITNLGGFFPQTQEDAFDRAVILIGQLDLVTQSSFRLPLSAPDGISTELPLPEANAVVAWNEDGDGLQNVGTDTLATIISYGTANADIFDGDGVTKDFTLSDNPGALNNLDVSIAGETLRPGLDYNWLSGTTLSFVVAPPVGTDNILVRYMQGLAQGSADGATVSYSLGVTSAVERNVQDRLRELPSLFDFGAAMDGVTDDLAALNAAIARINDGSIKELYIPAGAMVLSATPNAILADEWSIMGAGPGATRIYMAAGAGTAGTFFKLGDGSNSADKTFIGGFRLSCLNKASLNGVGNCFDFVNAKDCFVENIVVDDVNGIAKYGSDTIAVARIRFDRVEGSLYGPAGGTAFDVVNGTGLRARTVRLDPNGASVANALKGIHFHPGASNTCDSGVWHDIEFNFNIAGSDNALVMDATNGLIVNQMFTNCVFDHTDVASIKLLIGAGAVASARLRNIFFTSCRALSDGGNVVLIDNTGNKEIVNLQFNGGTLIQAANNNAVRIIGTLNSARNQILFNGVGILDAENTNDKVAIYTDTGYLRVLGCKFDTGIIGSTSKWSYALGFSQQVPQYVFEGNDCTGCTLADVDPTNQGVAASDTKKIGRNLVINTGPQARTSTANATQTTIASLTLNDLRAYHVIARVIGVKTDGTDRASYEIRGTFYRNGGGATLQGALSVTHAVESDATWDATLDTNGNDVRVRVTGKAATNITWSAWIEQVSSPNS